MALIKEYFDLEINHYQVGLTLIFHARCYNFFIVVKGMGTMIFASG